ncbi:putative quinol monooxygenase [Psychrobacter sp. LV10R520-6]|uniref:putative quinol monooxygenase n=1 Tax=Psychrobacter sp. LV10R520-6 TaxID=1415574 RepID=UPI0024CC7032|nr:putative quinol monooxygenase [Psychrobacter sp. LV10R520-6]SNT69899.1 Quinol monooxygenase YgiN [Psychrobacter sp. LV10R520-6]
MTTLTVIANIIAKDDHIALVKAELEKLLPVTRVEEGCLQYNLYQDNENLAHFMFHESWASRELWLTHMENQHLKDYLAATDGAVESFILNEMTEVAQ